MFPKSYFRLWKSYRATRKQKEYVYDNDGGAAEIQHALLTKKNGFIAKGCEENQAVRSATNYVSEKANHAEKGALVSGELCLTFWFTYKVNVFVCEGEANTDRHL